QEGRAGQSGVPNLGVCGLPVEGFEREPRAARGRRARYVPFWMSTPLMVNNGFVPPVSEEALSWRLTIAPKFLMVRWQLTGKLLLYEATGLGQSSPSAMSVAF